MNCYKCEQTILPSGKCYKNGSYFGEVETCPSPQDICYKEVKGKMNLCTTRKYPLHGYFLGVLIHTTALDQHWGRDETLEY